MSPDKQQLSPAVPHGLRVVHVPHQRAVLKFCPWSSDLQREQSPVTGGSLQRMANALLLMARRLLEVCGHDEVTVCRQPGDCWHKYREGTRFEASDTTGKNEIGIILVWQSAASKKSSCLSELAAELVHPLSLGVISTVWTVYEQLYCFWLALHILFDGIWPIGIEVNSTEATVSFHLSTWILLSTHKSCLCAYIYAQPYKA